MYQRMRAAKKTESGFTLIELLIVIVILGVLASIVVFAVGAFQNDGKTAACKSDVKNVEIAQEAYYAKQSPHAYAASVTVLVNGGYLREAPDSTEGISTDTTGAIAHTCSIT